MPHHFRIAFRSLLRRPGFSLAVVVTLALGLGANGAIFSVVDSLLVRTLPYPDADRLVLVWETVSRNDDVERRGFSYPNFVDLRDQARSFKAIAAYDPAFFTLLGTERAERVQGGIVSPAYFDFFGRQPSLGRFLLSEEARSGDEAAEVVLSHRLWTRHYGADSEVIGKAVTIDSEEFVVAGVTPPDLVDLIDGAELWISMLDIPQGIRERRGSRWHSVFARLENGTTLEEAQIELGRIFAGLEEQYPDSNLDYSASAGNLRSELFGNLQGSLLTLSVAVGLVLLIAFANVANLMLARSADRHRETALLSALGAGRLQLLGRVVAEAILLGLAGGLVAIAAAWAALRVLVARSPVALPGFVNLEINARVVLFALLLAVIVGLVLGFFSFRHWTRNSISALLQEAGSRTGRGRSRLRSALVAAEIAVALVLSTTALLFLESHRRLNEVDLGFQPEGLAFFSADPDGPDEAVRALRLRMLQRLKELPGVESAALATDMPQQGGYSATVIGLEGAALDKDLTYGGGTRVYRHLVSPGYFSTVGVPLLAGRSIEERDRGDGTLGVAVISESLADKAWRDVNALGKRFKFGPPLAPGAEPDEVDWVTVVGIVGDVRQRSILPDPEGAPEDPDIYFALEQFNPGNVAGVVRSSQDPASLLPTLEREMAGLSSTMPVFGLSTGSERLASQTARSNFSSSLLGLFALLSLALAAVGVYGVVSYRVAERTREIGVRIALGADRRRVQLEVLRSTLPTLLCGAAIGIVGALAIARLLSNQLHGVGARDPGTIFLGALLLVGVSLLACVLPAQRASRVQPVEALRQD